MTSASSESLRRPRVALACGGTGGHLYPALAIADALCERGADVLLLVSQKEVDQQAVRGLRELEVATLAAVALERGQWAKFLRGFARSYAQARGLFRARRPAAVLAMGGFTSVAPVLAGRGLGAATFLHEANAIPGRANRWLAHVVGRGFVYFPEAADRLRRCHPVVTGMPVRSGFEPTEPAACRLALGLDPERPVLLVVGGSQGAHGLNEAMIRLLPVLAPVAPELQFIHLTGPNDLDLVRSAYAAHPQRALVRPFLTEMELALGAATVAVSRAGASSLAEMAAMRVPSILLPFPAAADNHQFHNAQAFARTGAAHVLLQHQATPHNLLGRVRELLGSPSSRHALGAALAQWHEPAAAERIADAIVARLPARLTAAPAVAPGPRRPAEATLSPPHREVHA